jgi:hypothetical protein
MNPEEDQVVVSCFSTALCNIPWWASQGPEGYIVAVLRFDKLDKK